MTCRLGGSLPQMRGHWRRRRVEPPRVTQLVFVRLPEAPEEDEAAAAGNAAGPAPKPGAGADRLTV